MQITEVRDGVFYAPLVLGDGVEVSARPSDSIALALRTGSRIVCSEDVLDEAGLAVPDDQEEEVEKFREFLDQINPEDFDPDRWSRGARRPAVRLRSQPRPLPETCDTPWSRGVASLTRVRRAPYLHKRIPPL